MSLSELFFPRRRFLRLSLSSFLCFVGGFSMGSWLTLYHQFQMAERQLNVGQLQQQNFQNLPNSPDNLLNILILTAPRNTKARDTLRSTWLKLNPSMSSNSKYSTRHFFVIGTEGLSQTLLSKLEMEEQTNQDLVLLPDLKDSFNNLTLKVGLGLKYLATHYPSRYVLKCDDDSFVRIDEIMNELKEREKLIEGQIQSGCYQWGFFDGRAPVMRKGKWKEVEYNLCDYYIPYALGGGYVISSQCVNFIVQNLEQLKKFKNEDVSVGTWLAVLSPERRHDVRFDTQYESRGCNNKYLVQHKLTLAQMTERYKNLISGGRLCTKEEKKRFSWEYDWNVHPSHCCKLNDTVI